MLNFSVLIVLSQICRGIDHQCKLIFAVFLLDLACGGNSAVYQVVEFAVPLGVLRADHAYLYLVKVAYIFEVGELRSRFLKRLKDVVQRRLRRTVLIFPRCGAVCGDLFVVYRSGIIVFQRVSIIDVC